MTTSWRFLMTTRLHLQFFLICLTIVGVAMAIGCRTSAKVPDSDPPIELNFHLTANEHGTDLYSDDIFDLLGPGMSIRRIDRGLTVVTYSDRRKLGEFMEREALGREIPGGYEWSYVHHPVYSDGDSTVDEERSYWIALLVEEEPMLTGAHLSGLSAQESHDSEEPRLILSLTEEGAKRLTSLDGEDAQRRLVISIDSEVHSAVSFAIPDGDDRQLTLRVNSRFPRDIATHKTAELGSLIEPAITDSAPPEDKFRRDEPHRPMLLEDLARRERAESDFEPRCDVYGPRHDRIDVEIEEFLAIGPSRDHLRQGEVTSVEFTSDGRFAVTSSTTQTVVLWDVDSGLRLWTAELPDHVMDVSISDDQRRVLAIGAHNTASLLDIVTGEVIHQAVGESTAGFGPVLAGDLANDGVRAVTANAVGALSLWNPEEGRRLHQWDTIEDEERVAFLSAAVFIPDGNGVVAGGSKIKPLPGVWGNAEEVGILLIADHSDETSPRILELGGDRVKALAYAPDEQHLIVGRESGDVSVWDMATETKIYDIKPNSQSIQAIQIDDSGTVTTVGRLGDVTRWRLEDGQEVTSRSLPERVMQAAAVSPDGRRVFGAVQGKIRLWDIESELRIRHWPVHDNAVFHLAASPNGRWLFSGERHGGGMLWDLESGSVVHEFASRFAEFSPDSRYLLTWGGQLRLWDVASGEEVHTFADSERVSQARFSSDGSTVVATLIGAIRRWETATGDVVGPTVPLKDYLGAPTLSETGDLVMLARQSGKLSVLDTDSGEELSEVARPEGTLWRGAVLSEEASRVFLSTDASLVGAWNFSDSEWSWQHRVRGGPAGALALSPDGQLAAHGGFYLPLSIVDAASGDSRARVNCSKSDDAPTAVLFGPQNGELYIGTSNGRIIKAVISEEFPEQPANPQ